MLKTQKASHKIMPNRVLRNILIQSWSQLTENNVGHLVYNSMQNLRPVLRCVSFGWIQLSLWQVLQFVALIRLSDFFKKIKPMHSKHFSRKAASFFPLQESSPASNVSFLTRIWSKNNNRGLSNKVFNIYSCSA